MSTSYPRLLRLFQEFFSKIAVHTDTVYTLAQQSPETILTLRAIQPFENLYLTRSRNRLNEAVMSAFSLAATAASSQLSQDGGAAGGAAGGGGGGAAAVPTASGGLMLARAVVNELDAARFDPGQGGRERFGARDRRVRQQGRGTRESLSISLSVSGVRGLSISTPFWCFVRPRPLLADEEVVDTHTKE